MSQEPDVESPLIDESNAGEMYGISQSQGTGNLQYSDYDILDAETGLKMEILICLPQLISIMVVLFFFPGHCDNWMLKIWPLILIGRKIMSVMLSYRIATLMRSHRNLSLTFMNMGVADEPEITTHTSSIEEQVTWFNYAWTVLSRFGILWVLIGAFGVSSATECAQTAPTLYYLDVILVLFSFILIFLPCIFIIVAVPLIILCYPLISRYFPGVGTRKASEKEIDALPVVIFSVTISDRKDNQKKCAICLSDFENGDELLELPCGHRFKSECVKNWLRTNATCPVCRSEI